MYTSIKKRFEYLKCHSYFYQNNKTVTNKYDKQQQIASEVHCPDFGHSLRNLLQ